MAFAERLRQALGRSSLRISTPTELALWFNLLYRGNSVSNQAVQKWFSGENRPSPDKIEMLAAMLDVSPVWLRYGVETGTGGVPPRVAEAEPVMDPTEAERILLWRFRRLSPYQQDLVVGMIEQLGLHAVVRDARQNDCMNM